MNLFDAMGRPVTLIPTPFGEGGEGKVHEIPGDPTVVAKLYKEVQGPEKAEKLRAMTVMASPELLKVAAWPIATLHDRPDGPVLGILMPRVSGYREIHHLYSPLQRKKDFPQADWRFLAHAARNCAIAFETIHASGHVIGDVNQGNLLVSDQAMVRLIDCDSFQVRGDDGHVFRCGVGVAHFTPPELQGKPFSTIDRAPDHDLFGLAVLIFHLLMMGRHPFAGRFQGPGDMPLERAIQERRFAYSREASQHQMSPPPHTVPMVALSPEITSLLERAFGPPTGSPNRPTASEWKHALERFRDGLTPCPLNAAHWFLRGQATCHWCSLARDSGVESFIAFVPAPGLGSETFDLTSFWDQLVRLELPYATYRRSDIGGIQFTAKPPPQIRPSRQPEYPQSPVELPPTSSAPSPSPRPDLPSEPPALPLTLAPRKPEPLPVPDPPGPSDPRFEAWTAILMFSMCLTLFAALVMPKLFLCLFAGLGVCLWNMLAAKSGRTIRIQQSFESTKRDIEAANRSSRAEWKGAYRAWKIARKAEQASRMDRWELEKDAVIAAWESENAVRQFRWEQERRAILGAWESKHAALIGPWKAECSVIRGRWEADTARWAEDHALRGQRRDQLAEALDLVERRWTAQARTTREDHLQLFRKAEELKAGYQELEAEVARQTQELASKAEELQRRSFLDSHLIEAGKISGIGPARVATLRSYGIESALDIDESNLFNIQISGIGPGLKDKLFAWRRSVEASFRFDRARGIPQGDLRAIEVPFRAERGRIEAALKEVGRELAELCAHHGRAREQATRQIDELLMELAQAEADLAVMS